MIDTK